MTGTEVGGNGQDTTAADTHSQVTTAIKRPGTEAAERELPRATGVGICCSGGGIRAASYALGCLQVLEEKHVLHGESRADYLAGVSGGSYAVAATALVELSRHQLERELRDETTATKSLTHEERARLLAENDKPAFASGTPEMKHLRNGLQYLTHGPGGLRSELWRALMGVLMNVALLVSSIAIVGVVLGWFYGWSLPQVRSDCGASDKSCSTSVHQATWTWLVPVLVGGFAIVIGLLWVGRRWKPLWIRRGQLVSVNGILLAVALAILLLAMPQILAWMHRAALPRFDSNATAASTGLRRPWIAAGGLGGIVVALIGVITPAWRALGALASNAEVEHLAKSVFSKARTIVLGALTAIAVPLLFGGLLLLFMHHSSEHPVLLRGSSAFEWLWLVLPSAFLAVVALLGDLNSWSLHAIYRTRLADAFNLERTIDPRHATTPECDVEAQAREQAVHLAQLAFDDFPAVRICATSNIRNYGLVPTGMGAASFVFSQQAVGGDIVESRGTASYEDVLPSSMRPLSVMEAVSISGAAVAPVMGSMTRAPFRFLLALANVRLGVWMLKPNQLPEPVEPDASAEPAPNEDARRLPKHVGPGLMYLVHEAHGTPPVKAHYVYVTDGGHYDNLGLVDLLRQRCDWIWCIDASGDEIDTFSTLGKAVALAQAELGIVIDIQPGVMKPGIPKYWVKQPYCTAKITYPKTEDQEAAVGTLVVVKAGVPRSAPWAVEYYRNANPKFPCDSTLNQLFTAEQFDAYVALGNFSMGQAFANEAISHDWDACAARQRVLHAPR